MVTVEQRIKLLRKCEKRPRALTDFTQGEVHETVLSKHTEKWLAELAAEGLLLHHDGWYHITDAGLGELADLSAPPTTAAARIHCNAVMRQHYVPPRWHVRSGADQHRQYGSRGMGA